MENVLVMGGNQFLGKALCERLLKLGYNVFALNRGKRENLNGLTHLKADRNNKIELKEALKSLSIDIIVDISAYKPNQIEILFDIIKNNFKQYILISSASIYNDIKKFPIKETEKIGANSLWGDYAKDKFLCEEIVKNIGNIYYTIFRPFYIYGIGNNLDRENYMFSRIENEIEIFIPSKNNKIQFIYIEDMVNAIIYSFNNPKFYNEIFNIGGDEIVSFKKFAEICSKVIGKSLNLSFIDLEKNNLKARDFFPFRDIDFYGDITKLKNTGFKNNFTLLEGLKKTYKHLKK